MLTKDVFLKLIEEIDREISDSDLLFHQRPLHAFTKLTEKVDPTGTFIMAAPEQKIADNDFSNDALCAQVHKWYEERYGDSIKIHPGPGSYVLVIRNEPWKVVFPLCYGQNQFVVDTDFYEDAINKARDFSSGVSKVNVLWHINHMTYEVASSLSDSENRLF